MTNENQQATNQNDELAKYAGAGMDSIESSNQILYIRILQKGSAEIDVTHEDYQEKKIEGAKVGDIYHPTLQILNRPVTIVPVKFTTYYEERDGMDKRAHTIAIHPTTITLNPTYVMKFPEESIVSQYTDEQGNQKSQKNRLVKTVVMGVLLPDYENAPAIVKFQSSGLKQAKRIQEAIIRFRYPDSKDRKTFTFSRSFKLDTEPDYNEKKESWMAYKFLEGEVLKPSPLMDKAFNLTKENIVLQLQAPAASTPALEAPKTIIQKDDVCF